MTDSRFRDWSRRRFLHAAALALPAGLILGAKGNEPELDATPPCADGDDLTPPETAGPFFTPNSPERRSLLERGVPGTPIVLAGRVYSKDCRLLGGVLLDFWHADGDGHYDNEGYRCRGHQFTDADGRFRLETVVPGLYPGRTRHFHVRVQAPKGRILTTQLYFPGEPKNQRDGLYRPDLLMKVNEGETRRLASFDFVLGT